MVTQTAPPLPKQNCAPVGDEFGTPASVDLLRNPDYKDVIAEVSANLEASHAVAPEDLENGQAAGRALKALGCVACELGDVCTVRNTLEERVAIGNENTELIAKMTMIGKAPTWLKAARFQNSGMTPAELAALSTDAEKTQRALRDGTLDRLVGDVTNKPAGVLTKQQLPELETIGAIPSDKPLAAESVTTKNGQDFLVIDATINHGSKEGITDESRKEYGILCAKFLERLNNVGPDGQPQIMHQDQKMQKIIRRNGNSEIYEIRMSGKNRLYFSLVKSPNGGDGPVARIVILGAHGGDAATQRAFIDVSLN